MQSTSTSFRWASRGSSMHEQAEGRWLEDDCNSAPSRVTGMIVQEWIPKNRWEAGMIMHPPWADRDLPRTSAELVSARIWSGLIEAHFSEGINIYRALSSLPSGQVDKTSSSPRMLFLASQYGSPWEERCQLLAIVHTVPDVLDTRHGQRRQWWPHGLCLSRLHLGTTCVQCSQLPRLSSRGRRGQRSQ
jgi:hypothetical protein